MKLLELIKKDIDDDLEMFIESHPFYYILALFGYNLAGVIFCRIFIHALINGMIGLSILSLLVIIVCVKIVIMLIKIRKEIFLGCPI